MNAVLERLLDQRSEQVAFIDQLLSRVDADGRDLVDAETSNLTAARQRITELDAQIEPLQEFETLRDSHRDAQRPMAPRRTADTVDLGGRPARAEYASAGAFLVDYIAGRGLAADGHGRRLPADPTAAARVAFVLENQTTTDTPGILPEPIVGSVVNLIDASRPLITGIGGARSMGGIPGKTFGRPKITQHVLVGPQSAEKAELPSRKMVIGEVPFTKATYGGAVDVSRQDIDWSSPAAWDILIRDLADVYAQETENAAADAFAAAADDINAATTVPTNDLEGWATALYQAAGVIYASSKRLPDRLFVSTDVWSAVGPIVDTARLVFPAGAGPAGSSSLASFAGNMFELPRIVVPSFPAGTAVLAAAAAFEVYEEAIGLLTAVEPSLLGVEVAYGGYIAFNAVIPEAMAPLTAPAGPLAEGRQTSTKTKSS